jgi:hypothetical protein
MSATSSFHLKIQEKLIGRRYDGKIITNIGEFRLDFRGFADKTEI